MSRIRIYIPSEKIQENIHLTDKEIIHKISTVLRLNPKDNILIFDGRGKEYKYKISCASKKDVVLEKKSLSRSEAVPVFQLSLAFPLVKEDKIELILQKATELGVSQFIPFICRYSIQVKPSQLKLQRWEKIVIEAARQSERLWLPEISEVISFDKLCRLNFMVKLAAGISGSYLNKIDYTGSCAVFAVGPEGDFSDEELEKFKANNFTFIKLSENILRLETAAILAAGFICYTKNSGKKNHEG